MTAEDKCMVCNELIDWAEGDEDVFQYMEERIYAVNMGKGRVMLVKANSYVEALEKSRKPCQARWIIENDKATCSHCGYRMDVNRWEWLPAVRWYLKPKFCQECGADMRKEADNETNLH